MTRFRGCIDIHAGQVKQIVGGSLHQDDTTAIDDPKLSTNFISKLPSSHYASLYRDNDVRGTHVIKLGSNPENDRAAKEALMAWAGGMQIGGGINIDNAQSWLDCGASHVIVTSWLFPDGGLSLERSEALVQRIGRDKIVIDLSCRIKVVEGSEKWFVAMDKWQTMTSFELNKENITMLEQYCAEFLVHAADVEGLCQGIDTHLVRRLGEWCTIPVTYAGGARSINDLSIVDELSQGKVDLTYGSSLDIFGGELVKFEDCASWNDGR